MAFAGSRPSRRVNDDNVKWFTLAAGCIALFMAILDNLVVNVALPTISDDFSPSGTQLQWIISAYTLVFASLQITAGGLGDRFGRKRFFLAGVVVFTVTSGLAALVNSTEWLIAARAAQGLGAAFIMPLSLSLISAAFPPEERGKALGIWTAISVSGLALGPIVGGFIVEYFAWQWIFLINVPVGIAAFLVTSAVVRESRDESGTVGTDIPGTVAITGAIAALTWALIQAGERGWGDSLIIAGFVIAAVLLAAFIVIEQRTEFPMVPLRFFRSSTFTGANIDAFFISFLISGVAFSMTLYQQNVHGFSPVQTGMALLPLVVTMMIFAPISGALVNRLGSSRLIAVGMLVTGGSAFLFLRTGADASYIDIVPAMVTMGFGNALIFAPMTTAVLNSVESEKSGVASAVNGAIRETGFAFGVALLGTVMNQTYRSQFNGSSEIRALRESADPATAPLQEVLDLIGRGINYGGRVIENPDLFPGVPAPVSSAIRDASSAAFISGMDRAFIISGISIILGAFLSLALIKDRVADSMPEPGASLPVTPASEAVAVGTAGE
ncbi:MAG TPA: MFS transporter [Thermomicrobiales bacterium]|nr:MFS transporter [Thermomicrobiales bacterium]